MYFEKSPHFPLEILLRFFRSYMCAFVFAICFCKVPLLCTIYVIVRYVFTHVRKRRAFFRNCVAYVHHVEMMWSFLLREWRSNLWKDFLHVTWKPPFSKMCRICCTFLRTTNAGILNQGISFAFLMISEYYHYIFFYTTVRILYPLRFRQSLVV